MKHCGYCNHEQDDPCTDAQDAKKCGEPFYPNEEDDGKVIPDRLDPIIPDPTMYRVEPDDYVARGSVERASGHKDDEYKSRMDLIPPEMLFAVSEVLTFGANKYTDRNWEKGMKWGRVFGAIMRHLWAWWAGSKKDPETGMSHLWHAACCIAFLIAYEERGTGEDDRYEGTIE